MKHKVLFFLIRLIIFSAALFVIQYLILGHSFSEVALYYNLITIYLFNILATFLVYILLLYINDNYKDYTGYAFMAGSLLKMLAAVIFLLPMMLSKTLDPFINLLSFFIPYFLFLFFETFYAVKLINSK